MLKINNSDSLEEYKRKTAHNRRILLQSKAILNRAINAGIPKQFLRINSSQFSKLVCDHYHKDVNKLCNFIYKTPKSLINKMFITIDGGNLMTRKKAGFAILFRIIACDYNGHHKSCSELCHQLQTIRTNEFYRNDLSSELKDYDCLLISECSSSCFRNNFETGSFIDEILNSRYDSSKPTIITFSKPVGSENSMNDIDKFGQYLCMLSEEGCTESLNIRVKS